MGTTENVSLEGSDDQPLTTDNAASEFSEIEGIIEEDDSEPEAELDADTDIETVDSAARPIEDLLIDIGEL